MKIFNEDEGKKDQKNKSEIEIVRSLLSKSLSIDQNLIESKCLLARTYFQTDDHQIAIECSFEIIKKAKINKNYNVLCVIYMVLVSHYMLRRDFNKAIEYNNLARDLSKEIGNKNILGWTYEQFVWIYSESGMNIDKLEEEASHALVIFEELEDSCGKAHIHMDLSFYFLAVLGKIDVALEHINIAHQSAQDADNRFDLFIFKYRKIINYIKNHWFQQKAMGQFYRDSAARSQR